MEYKIILTLPSTLLKYSVEPPKTYKGVSEALVTEANLPVLIWVDENFKNNEAMVEHAKKLGIHVVQLRNTSEAKLFITKYSSLLEKYGQQIRIITNNARSGAGTLLEINAGEEITRFVRGRRIKSHILVYCGDLTYAKYTSKYQQCRATNMASVCQQYIEELSRYRISNVNSFQQFFGGK